MFSQTLSAPRTFKARMKQDKIIQWAVFLFFSVAVLSPLVPILYQSVLSHALYESDAALTIGNFLRIFGNPSFLESARNSLVFGFFSAVVAMICGVASAILVARTDLPGRAIFADLLLWPFYVSGIVLALGWITMYGPSGFVTLWVEQMVGFSPWNLYTMTGLSIVNGVSIAPLVFLYCVSSARMLDPSLEEAARVCGASPLRILLQVNLPMMRPALIFSAITSFIIGVESVAIPLMMGNPAGMKFFTTFIYSYGLERDPPDFGLVGASAVLLLSFVAIMLTLQHFLLKRSERFVSFSGKASQPRLLKLGRAKWLIFGTLSLYLIVAIGPVFFGVTLRAFTAILTPYIPVYEVLTFDNMLQVFDNPIYRNSIFNSLMVALIGGALGTVVVFTIATVSKRSTFALRDMFESIVLIPRAVPGLLLGIGAIYATAYIPFLSLLRGSIWILVIVFIIRFIPTGYGTIAPSLIQIGADLDKASRVVGASWLRTSVSIILPVIKPALASCFALLFIKCLNEYSSAVFLFGPGTELIGTTMLMFWNSGEIGPVSALAVVQIVTTSLFVIAMRYLFKVKLYG